MKISTHLREAKKRPGRLQAEEREPLWRTLSSEGTGARRHGAGTHLAPQQLSDSNEHTPKPLGQAELRAAEGLAPKFHNENLEETQLLRQGGGERC